MDSNVELTCFNLWAKTSEDKNHWHPLIWHLIDTGNVAKMLWKNHLSVSFKKFFCDAFNLSDSDACNLISFWVSLHDIGKAGPAFQKKWQTGFLKLTSLSYTFPELIGKECGYHGLASTWILRDYFRLTIPNSTRIGNALAIVLGGHHGEFPTNESIINTTYQQDHLGDEFWAQQRNKIIFILENVFRPPSEVVFPENRSQYNPVLIILAGLTTTSDWIASNTDYFPYSTDETNINRYVQKSLGFSLNALEKIGWGGWTASGKQLSFSDLFQGFKPNMLQKSVIDISPSLNSPFLLILEAQTGSGKTEAALYAADFEIQKHQKAGFYIAMPTQATSNQMFERTINFLHNRFPENQLNVHLVHGAALLNDLVEQIRFQGINQDQDELGHITSKEWFLPRKKTLLAPFGVGTVDQTFMAVLRSKHFFLRLFGLSNKIIIFDEVHAYDVYMVEIFKILLSWLRAINSSVIILSATLPKQSRLELIQAFGGDIDNLNDCEFPRLSIVDQNKSYVVPAGKSENREIGLQWINDLDIELQIKNRCSSGGNVAIICNRVARVQELYQRIKEAFPDDLVIAFHSRYPLCWRNEIEERIKKLYGKDTANRPLFSIVIATQVIEQSLDIDFDLVISDVAPIDLLIQRIGRLHRHQKTNKLRAELLKTPTALMVKPGFLQNGLPDFGKDIFVYQKYILEMTYYAISSKNVLILPEESDRLINFVYSENKPEMISDQIWELIETDYKKMKTMDQTEELKAGNQLIPHAKKNLFGLVSAAFSDEHDPQSFSIVQTQTRNMTPSVNIVCLVKTNIGLKTLADGVLIYLDKALSFQEIKSCLKSTVNINNYGLIKLLFELKIPEEWTRSASLRTKVPIVFNGYKAEIGNYLLVLDSVMGLSIIKKEG